MNEQLKNIDLKFKAGQRIFIYLTRSAAKEYVIESSVIDSIHIILKEEKPPSIVIKINNKEFPQERLYATIEEANEQAIAKLAAKRLEGEAADDEEDDEEDDDIPFVGKMLRNSKTKTKKGKVEKAK